MKKLFAATFSGLLAVGGFALSASAGDEEAGQISCLEAAAKGDYERAAIACQKELEADPTNDKLKEALETAKANIKDVAATPPAATPPAEMDEY